MEIKTKIVEVLNKQPNNSIKKNSRDPIEQGMDTGRW